MSAVDAVEAVCARLKTVAGVGPNVYNMLREAYTDKAFHDLFVDAQTDPTNPIVRAWRVTRNGTRCVDKEMNAMSRIHQIEVSGFMSYKDGVSEPIFQQVIEDISDAFDPLGGGNGSTLRRFVDGTHPNGQFDWSGPFRIEGPRFGMLRNVQVHAVLMIYPVEEYPL